MHTEVALACFLLLLLTMRRDHLIVTVFCTLEIMLSVLIAVLTCVVHVLRNGPGLKQQRNGCEMFSFIRSSSSLIHLNEIMGLYKLLRINKSSGQKHHSSIKKIFFYKCLTRDKTGLKRIHTVTQCDINAL